MTSWQPLRRSRSRGLLKLLILHRMSVVFAAVFQLLLDPKWPRVLIEWWLKPTQLPPSSCIERDNRAEFTVCACVHKLREKLSYGVAIIIILADISYIIYSSEHSHDNFTKINDNNYYYCQCMVTHSNNNYYNDCGVQRK